jgi:hypothetical protein
MGPGAFGSFAESVSPHTVIHCQLQTSHVAQTIESVIFTSDTDDDVAASLYPSLHIHQTPTPR